MKAQKFLFLKVLLVVTTLLWLAGCTPLSTGLKPSGDDQSVLGKDELSTYLQLLHREIVQLNGGVSTDRDLARYVESVGRKLVGATDPGGLGYRFVVLNETLPKVFSLPGFVGITRGLLAQLHSEAELAAVLACEIGHVEAGHAAQRVLKSDVRRTPKLPELSAESEYAQVAAELAWSASLTSEISYSREEEQDADRRAADLLAAAGYLPDALVDVLNIYFSQTNRGDDNDFAQLVRTHPVDGERVQRLQSYLGRAYPVRSAGVVQTDFAARMAKLQRLAEDYRLFHQARNLERDGRFALAIETYHEALQVVPDDPMILQALGLAYLRAEDLVPARRYLLKAVNLNAESAQARLGLGYIHLQKWQYAQAVSQLEQSLHLRPTMEAAFLLGEAQQQIGQPEKAAELFRIVRQVDHSGKLADLAVQRLKLLEKSR